MLCIGGEVELVPLTSVTVAQEEFLCSAERVLFREEMEAAF